MRTCDYAWGDRDPDTSTQPPLQPLQASSQPLHLPRHLAVIPYRLPIALQHVLVHSLVILIRRAGRGPAPEQQMDGQDELGSAGPSWYTHVDAPRDEEVKHPDLPLESVASAHLQCSTRQTLWTGRLRRICQNRLYSPRWERSSSSRSVVSSRALLLCKLAAPAHSCPPSHAGCFSTDGPDPMLR